MYEPAYIAIADDGHVTLYWGNGTEDVKEIILRGPRPRDGQERLAIIEDMKAWAEDHGYVVVVPEVDLEYVDIELELTEEDELNFTPGDVDDLLDDLFFAENSDRGPDDDYDF